MSTGTIARHVESLESKTLIVADAFDDALSRFRTESRAAWADTARRVDAAFAEAREIELPEPKELTL